MKTKLKSQKIMDFSIFRRLGTVEISCFKKNRGKGVIGPLSVPIQQSNCISCLLQKFELNPIIWERVTTKKWWFFHEKCTFEKCIQNLVKKHVFFENLDENVFLAKRLLHTREVLFPRMLTKFYTKRTRQPIVTAETLMWHTDRYTDTLIITQTRILL